MAELSPKLADDLFQGLAKELLLRLNADRCATCERSAATHQELQQIRQFLSDNGINASAAIGSPLSGLVKRLPFRDEGYSRTKAG